MIVYEPFKTVPLTTFHSEFEFEYPDLPSQLFDRYILRTAIDMAVRGNLLRQRVVINLESGVSRYALEPYDGYALVALMGARLASRCGGCRERQMRLSFTPPENASVCCLSKRGIWYDDFENVLHVSGCSDGDLYINISVRPPADACSLPVIYSERYLETLLMGARANILLIAGKSWTNLRLGGQMRADYMGQVKTLAVEAAMHKLRGAAKMDFGRAL